MATIHFYVPGVPKSMSVGTSFRFKRHGVNTHIQGRRNTDWATLVGQIGREYAPAQPLDGPVSFTAVFHLPRPASLPKKAAATAMPVKRPDVDGLVHKLTDRFNGVFWHDDSQIVDFVAVKRYVAPGGQPGVAITVAPVDVEAMQQEIPAEAARA